MKDTDPPTVVSAQGLTKCFGIKGPLYGDRAGDPSESGSTLALGGCALDNVTFAIPRGRVVGLLGRNGSGKTTLLRCLQGLALPTAGRTMLFGIDGGKLADNHLAKLGVVHQENRFLPWMTARTHLDFMRTFYATWDLRRELKLIDAFDLSMHERIDAMSPGAVQKLAIISATCHHPEVLLLDEPAASLDPPSREALFTTLFDLLRSDGPAIVISSHQLDDIERSVDWILCLERGRVIQDQALDVLQDRYSQWRVLPAPGASQEWTGRFEEPWIRKATIEREGALLLVEGASEEQTAFEALHGVVVQAQPLRLAQMFGLWMMPNARGQGQAGSVSGVVR